MSATSTDTDSVPIDAPNFAAALGAAAIPAPLSGRAFTRTAPATAPADQARVPTREERLHWMRTNQQFQELFRLSHEYQDLLDYMNGELGCSIRCVLVPVPVQARVGDFGFLYR